MNLSRLPQSTRAGSHIQLERNCLLDKSAQVDQGVPTQLTADSASRNHRPHLPDLNGFKEMPTGSSARNRCLMTNCLRASSDGK